MHTSSRGLTLIELLVVMAIIGVLAVLLVPGIARSRTLAQERAAQAYGHGVYKAAFAYVAEDASASVVAGDCTDAYAAGPYAVDSPGTTSVASCAIVDSGFGTPEVTVVAATGRTFAMP